MFRHDIRQTIYRKSKKTLPKAQRTQYIEYFDSFNTFSSKQKLQQALGSWPNFSLVLFGKGREIQLREIHVSILTNPCNNLREIHLTTLTNPTMLAKFNKNERGGGQGKLMIRLGPDKKNRARIVSVVTFDTSLEIAHLIPLVKVEDRCLPPWVRKLADIHA